MADDKAEAKKILKTWCNMQREKHGENWKEKLADEMASKAAPVLTALLNLGKK